jgi:hypothetical protein
LGSQAEAVPAVGGGLGAVVGAADPSDAGLDVATGDGVAEAVGAVGFDDPQAPAISTVATTAPMSREWRWGCLMAGRLCHAIARRPHDPSADPTRIERDVRFLIVRRTECESG